jgi:hypothetical protein
MDFRITMPRVMNMANQMRYEKDAAATELSSPVLPKEDTRVLVVISRRTRTDVAAVILDEHSLSYWHRFGKAPRWFHANKSWAVARRRAPRMEN